jgi:hypothetical protein
VGLAGRGSAQPFDLRCDFPCAPYGELGVKKWCTPTATSPRA